MEKNNLERILKGRGTTRQLISEKGALSRLAASYQDLWGNTPWFLIADENTDAVCGNEVRSQMEQSGLECRGSYIFPGSPVLTAAYSNVELLVNQIKNISAVPLVIGSGTLNDLVKRASFEAKTEYAVVATAASVDGYASDGAALLYEGVKQTFPCPAPHLILADPDILVSAPEGMTASGYGDLAGKIPAGADWILADIMNLDPVDREGWGLVHDRLDEWLSKPEETGRGEQVSLAGLFEGLSFAGIAMQIMKRSRPVSGAEHLISHIWEMQGLEYKGKHVSHGFKVAVGTIISLKLYQFLFQEMKSLRPFKVERRSFESWDERIDFIKTRFIFLDDQSGLVEINKEKWLDEKTLEKRRNLFREKWPEIENALDNYLPDVSEVSHKFRAAGCPVEPIDIGVPGDQVFAAIELAQKIRNRYTILDLLYELGYFHIPELRQSLENYLCKF